MKSKDTKTCDATNISSSISMENESISFTTNCDNVSISVNTEMSVSTGSPCCGKDIETCGQSDKNDNRSTTQK